MRYTYLLIDLLSVLIPLLFSFHPKLAFYKTWRAFFPAAIITGIIFIGWDMYFTHLQIWAFNPDYVTGVHIANLPVEEWLFFLCIPYACVFTYHCISLLVAKNMSDTAAQIITLLLLVGSVLMTIVFYRLTYTAYTFAFLAILLFAASVILKVNWLPRLYLTYLILLFPFLVVNGLLTGTGLHAPVVLYGAAYILRIRILTIPVEDVFYGMDLFILNLLIYSPLSKKIRSKTSPQEREPGPSATYN